MTRISAVRPTITALIGRVTKGASEPSLTVRLWRSEASSVSPITMPRITLATTRKAMASHTLGKTCGASVMTSERSTTPPINWVNSIRLM